jgi:hypothetical protein
LIEAWCQARTSMPSIEFIVEPGYGLAYSGPGGQPRSNPEFYE